MAGATTVRVTTTDAAAALVRKAATARAVESTAMNAVSSRSHSIFMLNITGRHAASATTLRGALNLVDLAGRCPPDFPAASPLSTSACLPTWFCHVHSACCNQCIRFCQLRNFVPVHKGKGSRPEVSIFLNCFLHVVL